MNKHLLSGIAATTFVASLAFAAPASAAVTFDGSTGNGFVGKGDVQTAFNLNNAQMQSPSTTFSFSAVSTTVTEVSWVCTNSKNENTQERERTTEKFKGGLLSNTARVKNQITGYNLTGYAPDSVTSSSTEGPAVNSCPTNWVLSTPAGDPVEVSSSAVISATYNGVTKEL